MLSQKFYFLPGSKFLKVHRTYIVLLISYVLYDKHLLMKMKHIRKSVLVSPGKLHRNQVLGFEHNFPFAVYLWWRTDVWSQVFHRAVKRMLSKESFQDLGRWIFGPMSLSYTEIFICSLYYHLSIFIWQMINFSIVIPCIVTDGYIYHGEHFIVYIIVKSLCHTPVCQLYYIKNKEKW